MLWNISPPSQYQQQHQRKDSYTQQELKKFDWWLRKLWNGTFELNFLAVFIVLSYLISIAAYIPSFFQYQDIEGMNVRSYWKIWFSFPLVQINNLNATSDVHYWHIPRHSSAWIAYSYLLMIGMKILPTLTVLMMNIIMIWRLSQLKLRKRYAKSSKFTSKQTSTKRINVLLCSLIVWYFVLFRVLQKGRRSEYHFKRCYQKDWKKTVKEGLKIDRWNQDRTHSDPHFFILHFVDSAPHDWSVPLSSLQDGQLREKILWPGWDSRQPLIPRSYCKLLS